MVTTVMLTAYLTVYDGLLSCYGTEAIARKPHRNRHHVGLEQGAEGFRGRVSHAIQEFTTEQMEKRSVGQADSGKWAALASMNVLEGALSEVCIQHPA